MRAYELINQERYEKIKNDYEVRHVQMNTVSGFKYMIFLVGKGVSQINALTFLKEMDNAEILEEIDEDDEFYFCVVSNFESPQFKY